MDHGVNPLTANRSTEVRQHEPVRRFACPVGFFRLKRFCYYLSAGTAQWRDAYFHCKDRNATLAILDRNGKDRMLRRYLMGDQFSEYKLFSSRLVSCLEPFSALFRFVRHRTPRLNPHTSTAKLERWIGGIYNWQQMAWEWGVTGEKMVFQSFGSMEPGKSEKYAWHCIIMDPALRYKWTARSCVERKHYICEVPAGRLGEKYTRGGGGGRGKLSREFTHFCSCSVRSQETQEVGPVCATKPKIKA